MNNQSNKINLFLGSGVSKLSGLPDAKKITNSIFEIDWHNNSYGLFQFGPHPDEQRRSEYSADKTAEFLEKIREKIYTNCNYERLASVNYEDIMDVLRKMQRILRSSHPATEEFEYIRTYTDIDFSNSAQIDRSKYLNYLQICKDLIQSVVFHWLNTSNDPVGFDLLNEICKGDYFNSVDIITLNHDLLIERCLLKNGISFNDGFSNPDGDVKWFNQQILKSRQSRIRLLKLHGSIDWYEIRINKMGSNELHQVDVKICCGSDPLSLKDRHGLALDMPTESYPNFATGTDTKVYRYEHGITGSMYSCFLESLDETNRIILSGFGWNDKYVSDTLIRWMSSSEKNKLILLHKTPESIKKSRSAIWQRYDDLLKCRRLVPVEKWFSDTKLEDIKDFLN